MSFSAGQTLSFYEILGPLGAGGMGEVYLARDTRLDREVAIKVLPEELAGDEDRLRRFEREAKTLASLNHPNVAGIYSIDQQVDTCFLAMELVSGEDLEDRLKRGALPLDEAFDICRQIAEGLEAAHEAGVVHRDLKPANVRITAEGAVKVLDFGLAKPIGPKARKSGTTSAQSDSFLATSEGMILGTPTYMSPEQARGKPVDRRTDIWAFGCVLYECLTGARAFQGDAFGDLIAAILEHDVDLGSLPDATPPRVRELIARCLAKDPRTRLRDLGEARVLLERVRAGKDLGGGAGSEPARRRSPGWAIAAALVVGGAMALGAAALAGGWSSPQSRLAVRTSIDLPQGLVLDSVDRAIALSPDGSRVALIAENVVDGSKQLYLRSLDRLEVSPVPGTEGASYPFWSPDGRSIGFFAGLKLKRIDLPGGIVRTLCDAPDSGRGVRGILYLAVGALPTGEDSAASDDRSWTSDDYGVALWAFHPETRVTRKIQDSAAEAFFIEPGFLAYMRDWNLMLQPFDPEALELTGEPAPVATDVRFALGPSLHSTRHRRGWKPRVRGGSERVWCSLWIARSPRRGDAHIGRAVERVPCSCESRWSSGRGLRSTQGWREVGRADRSRARHPNAGQSSWFLCIAPYLVRRQQAPRLRDALLQRPLQSRGHRRAPWGGAPPVDGGARLHVDAERIHARRPDSVLASLSDGQARRPHARRCLRRRAAPSNLSFPRRFDERFRRTPVTRWTVGRVCHLPRWRRFQVAADGRRRNPLDLGLSKHRTLADHSSRRGGKGMGFLERAGDLLAGRGGRGLRRHSLTR